MAIHATLDRSSQPRFLICPPRHFAVTYSINPWMDPNAWGKRGASLHARAERQWEGLREALEAAGAVLEILEPAAGLPDLVFTANAAVVLDGKVLPARFRHGERRAEEPVFAAAFAALKAGSLVKQILALPPGVRLEGAGDCLWDAERGVFWLGCGFRSDAAAGAAIEALYGVPAVALPLADPSFYHLDTAFCALPCGTIVYYPGAFTPEALSRIHERVAPETRIALDRADATRFAANAVCAGRTIVLSRCSTALRRNLEGRGYKVVETPLDVFQKSGGSACCLTLRLDHRSEASNIAAIMPPASAVAARGAP